MAKFVGAVYDSTVDKRDYLGECNDHAVLPDDFRLTFCVRCVQPECSRSIVSNSQFEARVSTWAERLFLNVPRLDPSDPRYQPLATQKFVTIDVGRPHEVQGWIDPLEPQPEPAPAPSPPAPEPVPLPEPVPEQAPSEPKVPARLPRRMVLANAPDQSGRMLAGANRTPTKDPWASPEPEKNVGTVVSSGARIKLGGSGV